MAGELHDARFTSNGTIVFNNADDVIICDTDIDHAGTG